MIDWGGGLFLGLKFGFVLIVLAVEFYFLVLDKYTEGDISRTEFAVLLTTTAFCIIVPAMQLARFSLGLWPIIPLPLLYGIFRVLENSEIERTDKRYKDDEIRNLEKVIARKPEIPEAYVKLGDIHFRRNDYEKALYCYRKSYDIKGTDEVHKKIRIAEKELRIQRGEIWVCGQCGADNPGTLEECRACGNSNKPMLSIRKDLIRNKEEIKRWTIMGFAVPFGTIFFLILLRTFLPADVFFFLSICISMVVVYILLKKFMTW